jgi:hypothetical protein
LRLGPRGLAPLALALVLGLAGCRPAGEPAGSDATLSLHWQVTPDPPVAGPLRIALELSDQGTQRMPLSGAVVRIEGNMSHPGMEPVLAAAREVAPGRYEAPLTLTMAGDWIFFVDAVLPDGRKLHRQIDFPGVRPPGASRDPG